MTTVTVTLTDEMKRFLEEQAATLGVGVNGRVIGELF